MRKLDRAGFRVGLLDRFDSVSVDPNCEGPLNTLHRDNQAAIVIHRR